jgi:hypothetical protein
VAKKNHQPESKNGVLDSFSIFTSYITNFRHQPVINPPNIKTSVAGGAPEVVTPAEQAEPPEERPVPVVSGLALLSPCLGMGIGWILMEKC